jgi:hypothetical protein
VTHVTEIAVQVHGNDGFGTRCDRSFGQVRVYAPGVREDVDEDRRRPEMDDRGRRRDPRALRHDHLVAEADSNGCESEMDGAGAAAGRDREPDADVGGELAFELV